MKQTATRERGQPEDRPVHASIVVASPREAQKRLLHLRKCRAVCSFWQMDPYGSRLTRPGAGRKYHQPCTHAMMPCGGPGSCPWLWGEMSQTLRRPWRTLGVRCVPDPASHPPRRPRGLECWTSPMVHSRPSSPGPQEGEAMAGNSRALRQLTCLAPRRPAPKHGRTSACCETRMRHSRGPPVLNRVRLNPAHPVVKWSPKGPSRAWARVSALLVRPPPA